MDYFVAVPINMSDFNLLKAATYLPNSFYNVANNPVFIWHSITRMYRISFFSAKEYTIVLFYF